MIKVDGNLSIGTYNDNSGSVMTFSPQGTIIEQQVASQENASGTQAGNSTVAESIRLNKDISKIDFIRIINAMCECAFFTTTAGTKANKKDVFAAMGKMLDIDFSNFHKNLSESKNLNNDSSSTTDVFMKLRQAALSYINK